MSNFLLFLTMYQLHSYNYYPFGSPMPERSFSSPSYRYGFNGMEKDDEVKGSSGTSYDFGARMYDSRLGRFFAVDPFIDFYPKFSTYQFALNNPIDNIDFQGLYGKKASPTKGKSVKLKLKNLKFISTGWVRRGRMEEGYFDFKFPKYFENKEFALKNLWLKYSWIHHFVTTGFNGQKKDYTSNVAQDVRKNKIVNQFYDSGVRNIPNVGNRLFLYSIKSPPMSSSYNNGVIGGITGTREFDTDQKMKPMTKNVKIVLKDDIKVFKRIGTGNKRFHLLKKEPTRYKYKGAYYKWKGQKEYLKRVAKTK